MTADSRIEALEKKVAEQGEQIKGLMQELQHAGGAESAHYAAIIALLFSAPVDGPLDDFLNRRLIEMEASTIASAQNEHLAGFEEARESIEEARTQAHASADLAKRAAMK